MPTVRTTDRGHVQVNPVLTLQIKARLQNSNRSEDPFYLTTDMMQIASGTDIAMVRTVELLD